MVHLSYFCDGVLGTAAWDWGKRAFQDAIDGVHNASSAPRHDGYRMVGMPLRPAMPACVPPAIQWAVAARTMSQGGNWTAVLDAMKTRRRSLSTWYALLAVLAYSDQKPDLEAIGFRAAWQEARREDEAGQWVRGSAVSASQGEYLRHCKKGENAVALSPGSVQASQSSASVLVYGSDAWMAQHTGSLPWTLAGIGLPATGGVAASG